MRIEQVSIGETCAPACRLQRLAKDESMHIRGFLSFGADRGRLCVMADDRW